RAVRRSSRPRFPGNAFVEVRRGLYTTRASTRASPCRVVSPTMAAARFLKSPSEPSGFPRPDQPEVAFVGRRNSGKSSVINGSTGVRKLARVSKTPGRTQLINFFEAGSGRRIVDLPGYGFAKVAPEVRKRWRSLLDGYLRDRPNLRGLVVTIDIRRGVTELDRTMLDWAEALGLSTLLLLTKADKVSRNDAA